MPKKAKSLLDGETGGPRLFRPTRPIGLARALMKAGYGTRKQTNVMVLEGRIQIDKKTVLDPLSRVGPENEIHLDHSPLMVVKRQYFAFHKPLRVVCTPSDGPGRKLVEAYWPRDIPGLQAAGRLDGRTTGLLLISNDTAWNNMITQCPGLELEYRIQIEGLLSEPELAIMSAGVHLPKSGLLRPDSVTVIEQLNNRSVVAMVVHGSQVRQVRQMFSTLRRKVTMLSRVRVGGILVDDLAPGEMRPLFTKEVDHMRAICSSGGLGKEPGT